MYVNPLAIFKISELLLGSLGVFQTFPNCLRKPVNGFGQTCLGKKTAGISTNVN